MTMDLLPGLGTFTMYGIGYPLLRYLLTAIV